MSTIDTAAAIRLAEPIRAAGSVVALTGAGISVPPESPTSGLRGTGLWTNVDPMEVAHIDVFRRDPERFWHFYGDRFQTLEHKRPNAAHDALAQLERAGLLDAVITQNIDRLHAPPARASWSRCTARSTTPPAWSAGPAIRSPTCGAASCQTPPGSPAATAGIRSNPTSSCSASTCPRRRCSARRRWPPARPDALHRSSLEVYPVAQLPAVTLAAGGEVAIITQGRTPFDERAAVRCGGDVVHELQAVIAALQI